MKPVGPTFHRSFPLQRPVLSEYLRAVVKVGANASAERIRDVTGLGTMKIPSALGYGKGSGLLDSGGQLSELGRTVLTHDPGLSKTATQWLLHTGLTGISSQAPVYWGRVWNMIGIGSAVQRGDIEKNIIAAYEEGFIKSESARVSCTALLSTYANADGLRDLNLIERTPEAVAGTVPREGPATGVVAFALVSRWQALHPDQLTTNLDRFLVDSRLLDFFRLSREGADGLLDAVARRGDIEIYRTAPPHQIVRRWHDPAEVTSRIYEESS